MLEWSVIQAWNGFRLNPNVKCGITQEVETMTDQLCRVGAIWITCIWLFAAGLFTGNFAIAENPHVEIGRFPQEVARGYTVADGLPSNDVLAVYLDKSDAVWARTNKGWTVLRGEKWMSAERPARQTLLRQVDPDKFATIECKVNQAATTPDGRIVVATEKGLLVKTHKGFQPLVVEDGQGRCWGTSDTRGVAVDSRGQLWFATLAGAACRAPVGWRFFTGSDGLPYNDFTHIAPGPGDEVWFGTHLERFVSTDALGHIAKGRDGYPTTTFATWPSTVGETPGSPQPAVWG